MKVESCGKDCYRIFINCEYIKDINFDSFDEIISFVKRFILKIKNRFFLRGFYKVRVYFHKVVGMFLDITKLDDMDVSNNLDLRIVIMEDDKLYFETEDYEIIEKYNGKRYKDGMFYCVVDDSFDKVLEKVEFGRFIYGKEVINLLNNSLIL